MWFSVFLISSVGMPYNSEMPITRLVQHLRLTNPDGTLLSDLHQALQRSTSPDSIGLYTLWTTFLEQKTTTSRVTLGCWEWVPALVSPGIRTEALQEVPGNSLEGVPCCQCYSFSFLQCLSESGCSEFQELLLDFRWPCLNSRILDHCA